MAPHFDRVNLFQSRTDDLGDLHFDRVKCTVIKEMLSRARSVQASEAFGASLNTKYANEFLPLQLDRILLNLSLWPRVAVALHAFADTL